MTSKIILILCQMHLVMGSSDSSPTRKRLISFVDNKPIHYTNQCTTTAEPLATLPFSNYSPFFGVSLGHPPTHCPTNSTFSFISLGHPPVLHPTNSTFPSLRWSPFLSASTAFQQAILRPPAPPKSHRLHGLR